MEKLITEFSIGLFFWQTVIFIFLILLLKKFAWKPILDAVNEREEGIKNALLSAEKAKEEMASLQSDNEETLKKARSERDSLLKEAREIKQQLIDEAKREGEEGGEKVKPKMKLKKLFLKLKKLFKMKKMPL